MEKAKLDSLVDLKDNYGNFTGYSVDSDGVVVNTSNCPFPFLDEPQDGEILCKIYNDGGHYIAYPYFHSTTKRPERKTRLQRVFDELYYKAIKKQRLWEKCNFAPCSPLDADIFIEKNLGALRKAFPDYHISRDMLRRMIKEKQDSLLPEDKIGRVKKECDLSFDSLYDEAVKLNLTGQDLIEHVKEGLSALEMDSDLDEFISDKLEKKKSNLFARKKRFRRKGYLNKWTHFVTLTYDDKKHTALSFREKLRKCLCNLHTRRGWKYMGVFEAAPDTGRLHFHGLFYIPDGEMVGNILEKQDYSTRQGKVQTRQENDFFAGRFGRNDFEEISVDDLRHGKTLEYIMKYVEKTGERVVYSRGIPSQVCKVLPVKEIVGRLQDFVTKFVLFDDSISWERDVMKYREDYTQLDLFRFKRGRLLKV